ncbi:hypothetical protein H6G93_24775 [Nostoc sp. FACHB-973]|nr:hypothetical protein [Nostoc sp. FACHB-973]
MHKPELIKYYFGQLALIANPHLRVNPNTKKDFLEVISCPHKFAAFDIAVELHRAGSRPWVG